MRRARVCSVLVVTVVLLLAVAVCAAQPQSAAPAKDDIAALLKRAQAGDAAAQWGLAYSYQSGQGVPQDYAQAAVWYRKAAEQGDAQAQNNLGGLYGLGRGLPEDDAEAYFWMNIALAGNLGDKEQRTKSEKVRDAVASTLTPAKLQEVQARATKWFEEHPAKIAAQ